MKVKRARLNTEETVKETERDGKRRDLRPLALLMIGCMIFASSLLGTSTPAADRRPSCIEKDQKTREVWLAGGNIVPGLYRLPEKLPVSLLYQRLGVEPPEGGDPFPAGNSFVLADNVPPISTRLPARLCLLFFEPIPVNSADRDTLVAIPGIGPWLAENIISWREGAGGRLSSLDELLQVSGIGPAKLKRLRQYLSCE